jgi:hypothetical protein
MQNSEDKLQRSFFHMNQICKFIILDYQLFKHKGIILEYQLLKHKSYRFRISIIKTQKL